MHFRKVPNIGRPVDIGQSFTLTNKIGPKGRDLHIQGIGFCSKKAKTITQDGYGGSAPLVGSKTIDQHRVTAPTVGYFQNLSCNRWGFEFKGMDFLFSLATVIRKLFQ